jgi:EAL and modified HD-GYP domain-containing signal transduction protein
MTTEPSTAARDAVPAEAASLPAYAAFIGRQPVLDRDAQLIGYELLYRANAEATEARFDDDDRASLVVIASLLQDLGADRVLGGKIGFINVGSGALGPDSPIGLLDPKSTVLEFDAPSTADDLTLARLAGLRREGYGIAVTVDSPGVLDLPAFRLATHAKVDVLRIPAVQLPHVVALLRSVPGRRVLVAEKVETREQATECMALGFDCLQGFFFARPETLTSRRLEPSRAAVLQAIKLLLRNADVSEVDRALKADVALSVKLLRYMNSAGMGLTTRIESLRHAIALLGYAKLARWLTLLLASSQSRDPTAPLLARTAITRGRMIELLGEGRFEPAQADYLFIAGTFSLLPAMLMVPMSEALKELDLPEPVTQSLLDRSGPYAPYLKLVEACEDPTLAGVAKLCAQLSITPKELVLAQTRASDWVAQLGL